MNSTSPTSLCPCESGLLFSDCCGVDNRRAISADIVAVVAGDGSFTKHDVTPQIQSSLVSVGDNPDLFPARIDFFNNKAWLVKMSPRWYRESIFLDPGRIKGTIVIEADLNWLKQVCDNIVWQPTSFIFHTAFCGSTLMSQALDALFHSLPLREPEVLGNLLVYQRSNTENNADHNWVDQVLRLLSRPYVKNESVVVKANDYANPLMRTLTDTNYSIPMLFMYTPLSEFLAGCLKAKNRLDWIKQRYQSIVNVAAQWLKLSQDVQIGEESYGKMAAIYWSYNIALYLDVYKRGVSQTRSLNFNQMLAHPLEAVTEAGSLFRLTLRQDIDVSAEIAGLFGVYSKNNKFLYSPVQRANDIQSLLKQHRKELDEAEQLAQQLLENEYPTHSLPGNLLESMED
ncbi:hypothetical protein [Kaarinaea lacus]